MSDSREPYVSPSLEASRRRIAARRQEQETLGRLLAPIERQKLEIGLAGLSPEQQKTTRETFLQARALNQIYDIPMDDALVRGDLYRRALAPDIKKAQGFIEHSVDNIRLNSLMWDIGTEHWAVARNHGEPLEKGQSVEIMRKELEEVLKRKADFQKRMRDGGIDIGGGNYVKPNMTPEERAEEEQLIKRERELNKMLSGRGADVGGGNYVPVDNEITLADLEAEEEKIKARLFTDSDVVSAMGTAIGTLGFMKYSAPAALAATVATGGNALAGSAVAAAVDYSALAGLAYRDMRRAGIEHEVAFSKAAISAGAQSLLEFAFGATPVEGFVTRKIGGLISTRFVMKGTVAKAVADVARNGVGTRAAAKALAVATAKEAIAGAPIRALMEGATEAAQALTSNFMMELAAIESDRMFGGVDFKAIEENKENIAENFFMGALASGLLGVVPSTIKVLSTPAQVAKVKQDVVTALFETGSVEGAVKKLEGTAAEELLTTEGVKQAVETVRQEYKKQLGERDVEIAPGMIEPTPDTPAAARRDANGRLALYEEADVDRKGNSVLSVKSPVGDNTYASITFKRDGDRIILKDAKAEGYVTDGDAVISEALKALKKENPRAVFDGRRDLMVAAETKMGLSEVRAVDALLKEMMGKSADETLTKVPFDRMSEAQISAVQAHEGQYRGVTIPIEGKQVAVYGENADASTKAHESFHAYIRKLEPERQNEWAQAIGLKDGGELEGKFAADGKEYQNGHEYLAEKWEEYLTLENPSIPQRLKELFDRVVEVMRKLVGREANIPERLRAKFDELASGEARLDGDKSQTPPPNIGKGDGGQPPENGGSNATQQEEAITTSPESQDEANARVLFALDDNAPVTPEQIAEAKRQYEEVEARYTNPNKTKKAGWMKAPNGEPTQLTERQWVQVRTPAFKQWFGEWENLALKNRVDETALQIALEAKTAETAAVAYGKLGEEQAEGGARLSKSNKYDGRRIEFVKDIFGKLRGHNTRELLYRIIPELDNIYEKAVPIYFEPERNPKKSTNIVGFHHYLAKVKDVTGEYYVRISAQELKRSWKNKEQEGAKQFHNAAISEVEVYKTAAPSVTTGVSTPATTTAGSSFIDKELQKWLDSVNPSEVSKAVDQNGEPLVVYKGTDEAQDTLGGFFASDRKTAGAWSVPTSRLYHYLTGAEKEGHVYGVFLDMKNPFIMDAQQAGYDSLLIPAEFADEIIMQETADTDLIAEIAKKKGYDGVIIKNVIEGNSSTLTDDYITFDLNQAKSATGNAGTFSKDTDSLLFQLDRDGEMNELHKIQEAYLKDGTREERLLAAWIKPARRRCKPKIQRGKGLTSSRKMAPAVPIMGV